jgi:hypothetical protein
MYFNSHPLTIYNDGEVVNIFTKVIPIKRLLDNAIAWELYDLQDGESPELLSYKLYGSVEYHWVLMMMNDIVDINKDWQLSSRDFNNYVYLKYDEPDARHHWEDEDEDEIYVFESPIPPVSPVKWDYWFHSTEKKLYLRWEEIWVEVTTPYPATVSNYVYEERINNAKGKGIKVLKPEYLDSFVKEFKSLL